MSNLTVKDFKVGDLVVLDKTSEVYKRNPDWIPDKVHKVIGYSGNDLIRLTETNYYRASDPTRLKKIPNHKLSRLFYS